MLAGADPTRLYRVIPLCKIFNDPLITSESHIYKLHWELLLREGVNLERSNSNIFQASQATGGYENAAVSGENYN